jgi:hypothetical protein
MRYGKAVLPLRAFATLAVIILRILDRGGRKERQGGKKRNRERVINKKYKLGS